MLDIELTNCRIFGKDESLDTIGIKDGRIVEIGRKAGTAANKSIDLQGRVVLPGFIDSHTHLLNLGLSMVRLDLSTSETRSDALDCTRQYALKSKGKVIVGYGWDETRWGEKDYLSRNELDFSEKPIILYRKDMHMAVANSSALSLTGLSSADGAVKEEALQALSPLVEPDDEETRAAISAAAKRASSEGITTVRDIMGLRTLSVVESQRLPVRVFRIIYDREYDNRAMNGAFSWGIKMFLDGSIGSKSAAHKGWSEENLKFSDRKLAELLDRHWSAGIPVAMHAIGDVAVMQAVSSLKNQKGSLRNSIEHCELVTEEELDSITDSTTISSQPNFLQWSMKGGLYEMNLGKEWFGKDNPFRDMFDRGIRLAFGSDTMPIGPSFGIGLAVSAPHKRQKISLEEAISAYTSGGAYLLHEEDLSGKIETGYRADLAVFDENYLSDKAGIGKKKAYATVVGGTVEHGTENF